MNDRMEEQLDRLEITAKIVDVPIEVRELVDSWLLITYDIPATEEGHRARREFLKLARLAGAVEHIESTYVLPWSPLADIAVLEAAAHGRAFIWYSKAKDTQMAEAVTRQYDKKADQIFDDVEERIDRIKKHLVDGKRKLASRMLEKTDPMINGLERMAVQRGSLELYDRWKMLRRRYDAACVLAEALL